ncbi:MAG: PD-(D/E)XK nuclease family protein [Planctomycetes bacterium]|nr:PD-(D/E)XK nuclease family protein [Planctomycetota bacterium]
MLSVLTGSFRYLEDELVRRLRARPPLEPACVVVPGGQVAGQLRRALAAAGGVAAARVCNFHALAKTLLEDAGVPVKPVVEEAGEEEIFRAFLREPGSPERYRRLADRPGASAVLATVRDLRAATLTPPLLAEVKEELPEDAQRLAELGKLLELYRDFLFKAGFTTRAAVSAAAAEVAERAPLVRATPTWAVYGFYEFLGEQMDLLHALARAADITVFLPWRDAPAWKYVDRTLNEDLGAAQARKGGVEELPGDAVLVQALKTRPPRARGPGVSKLPSVAFAVRATTFVTRLFDPGTGIKKGDPPVKIVSAAGRADEMWYAVKKARDLHESEGIAWHDIAILARTLDGRLGLAERYFREECVPWATTAARPLFERPLAQAASLAARLFLESAYHADVLEWFASPLVKESAQPEAWGEAARALGIVSGDDWRRLDGARGADLLDGEGEPVVGAATVDAFAEAVAGLRGDLAGAGRSRGWHAAAEAWEGFLASRLDTEADPAAWLAVRAVLRGLSALEGAAAPPGPEAFAGAFARALAAARIPAQPRPADGVAFLDLMAARGRRFRAAILLGLNEKEWPRIPREDPHFPDASRARVAATTGVKLLQKMDAIAEERLLFALAIDAADRVILVHRRVDDEGRKEAPSAYLDEVRRVAPPDKPVTVPRLPVRKYEIWEGRLTPVEKRLHAILTGAKDPDPAVVKARDLELYGRWTEFDVLPEGPAAHLAARSRKGFSPTALETLATCPFKYWATRVAGLRILDPLEAEEDTAAREVGAILHEALAREAEGDPAAIAREIFRERAEKRPPLRWAVWEAARDEGIAALEALVAQDRAELKAGGWTVRARELELPRTDGPDPLPGLHGRVDRIETRDAGGATEFRVTDFKYIAGKRPRYGDAKPATVEGRVLKEAARGLRLQLLVYARLAAAKIGPEAKFAGSSYYFFGPRIDPVRQGLLEDDGAEALAALAPRVWNVASHGHFVIVEDDRVCSWCDARSICRRGHHATRTRALQDPRFREFREARL